MKYKIIEPQHYQQIQARYHINSLLAKVIESRQYDEKTLKEMMNPRLIYHDFSLFEEADMTLERIHEAIEQHEKICIYGDYDCDGILATTILVQAFLELGVKVGYHIPHRFEDGYGLNVRRVEQMAEKGYTLIITVDNGVKAFEAVERANELGIDVIITDHHQFDQDLPDACTIIHAKLSPDYPFKEISGGYVAYKLASALLGRQDKYLFCLAAITTISDMMPLLNENRSLVRRALTFMKEEKYLSLELLLGNQQTYSTYGIGFVIAPKINSFGRLPELCSPNILVKYFLKNAPRDFMVQVAQMATSLNTKRQTMTNQQYELAKQQMNDDFLCWASDEIHEGIMGLIAGKYTREYERPSFVMNHDKDKGLYKGSARSVEGFSLHQFFMEHQDQFVICGGHSLAGGFTVDEAHFDSFCQCVKDSLQGRHFQPTTSVLQIDENDIVLSSVESLSLLEPFGMKNEEPLYILKNVPVSCVQQMGQGKHLKMESQFPHGQMSMLYFQHGDLYGELKNIKTMNVIGTLQINEYRHQKSINFIIKDIV